MSTPTPGRRSAARQSGPRIDVTMLLAVGLPLLALVAVLLVRPGDTQGDDVAPEKTALTRATVICPSGDPGIVVASDTDASGEALVRQGRQEESADLAPRRPTEVSTGEAPAVVTTEGDLAPGLLAGRFGEPLVAPECRAPAFDEWFTGVGAGAKHSSVLELVNPDPGPAVVDVLAYGRRGPVDAPALRGVAVPGRSVVNLDLSQEVPRRDDLALHVTTTRGRVSASAPGHLRRARLQRLGHRLPAVTGRPGHQQPAARTARRHRPPDAAPGQPCRDRDPRQHQGRHRGRGVRRRGHRRHRDPTAERRPGVGRHAVAREERGRRDGPARRVQRPGDCLRAVTTSTAT